MNKVDKGHAVQHHYHCAASLHGQTPPAACQPGQALWVLRMRLCLQPDTQPRPSGSQGGPLESVLSVLASGQQPRGGVGGAANTWGTMLLHLASPSVAKLVWELLPSPAGSHPSASLPHRRATTPFPCTSSAACLTTGKLDAHSHMEFKNKTSKRAPCSLKKPKQFAPKSKHLPGLAQSADTSEAESAPGGSSTHQLQGRRERGTRTGGRVETTELHPTLKRKRNSTQADSCFCRRKMTTSILKSLGGWPDACFNITHVPRQQQALIMACAQAHGTQATKTPAYLSSKQSRPQPY